jgi:hypothetical protein
MNIVLVTIRQKIKEDVSDECFQALLDSIEVAPVEAGRDAYRRFKASCKAAGVGTNGMTDVELIKETISRR